MIYNAKSIPYFSRLMQVYVGLTMLAAYFFIPANHQVEFNCAMRKVDWLAACIALGVVGAVLVVFLRCWRKICTILQPVRSKGRYLKKCSKPCWPIKGKETWTKYGTTSVTLLSQRKLALTERNTLLRNKIIWSHKNLKNVRVPYLGLELTMHVIKSQIHLVRQSL
jgi:hypothetical protein